MQKLYVFLNFLYFSVDKSVCVKILSYLGTPTKHKKMETILRASYLEQLKNFRDKQVIKVITGFRPCLLSGGRHDER